MMDDKNLTLAPQGDDTEFFKQVSDLLEAARQTPVGQHNRNNLFRGWQNDCGA